MIAEPLAFTRSRAVLIGTSVYHDTEFLPLPAAANSLRGMAEILADGQLCRWPADRVTVLPNPADSRRVITALRRWARETQGVLLVYFVGHGTVTPGGELCLAVTDTEFSDPDVTGIEYGRIRSALLDSPARIKVVILDCCYSGRAIQALGHRSTIADITDIRGVYTITASDHAAHVPPLRQQKGACTSFTGELLDLIRTGIPGGPETLTLSTIYSHLRDRLRSSHLPAPNQRGTDTAGDFVFTRNASLLPGSLARFPRPPAAPVWRSRAVAAVAVAAVSAGAAFATASFLRHGPVARPPASCGPGPGPVSRTAHSTVVVGAQSFKESRLLADIYVQALAARHIRVSKDFNLTSREDYYRSVCAGQITVVPEYNGALLKSEVNPSSRAITTPAVDAALTAQLPPSLMILRPAPAQDQDSVTVTQSTAARYHLESIADLGPVAGRLVFGGPPTFQGREQGLIGLTEKYGVTFRKFTALDLSGPRTLHALVSGQVQAADVFTTDPEIKAEGLVTLTDPRHLFTAQNVVPLVYRAGVTPTVIRILNDISAKLTTPVLLALDTKVIEDGQGADSVAAAWLRQAGLP